MKLLDIIQQYENAKRYRDKYLLSGSEDNLGGRVLGWIDNSIEVEMLEEQIMELGHS